MARFYSANQIINRAALECGLLPVSDPVSSDDESFIQLTGLLNSSGEELVEMFEWQGLRKKYEITTQGGDTGTYDLPDDFSYMIDQTGWNKTSRLPVGGPMSAQSWSYLDGSGFLESPIYAIFEIVGNKFELYPQPPAPGIEVAFQYQSRNWVTDPTTKIASDTIGDGADLVMFEPIMAIKMLKAMFLSAKGLPAQDAKAEFESLFLGRTGKDTGAQVINAAGAGTGIPLLNQWNVPWTGYGS